MPVAARAHAVRALLAVALLVLASGAAADEVTVSNFPATQRVEGKVHVEGSVSVDGHVDSTRFVSFEGRSVRPQSDNARIGDLVSLGHVSAEGFATLTVSLATRVPSGQHVGRLGLLLLPDVAVVNDAVHRDNSTPFAMRFDLPLASTGGTTAFATSKPLPLAFPVWNAYLVNTDAVDLDANVFLMMGD